MRRGLMGWNAEELPVAALRGAAGAAARRRWTQAGMDAFVVYTNNVRPAAMNWITGFTPYWSDALLLVQQTGAPAFATALSKRVSEWIRTTDPVSEIVNTPKPGEKIGERLKNDPLIRRVGVLEYDTLPAGLAHDLETAAPAVEWIDGTAMFAGLRREIDDAERGLLARCDAHRCLRRCARRKAARRKMPGTLAGWSSRARDLPAPKRRISLSRPISMPTPGSIARRSRRRWRSASRCARRLPTRAAGFAARGPLRRMTQRRRPMRGLTLSLRSIEAGKPLAAQLADKDQGTARRHAAIVDGRKLHRQLSAFRCRVVADGRKCRANGRTVPGADCRVDARWRAVDWRCAADCWSARLVASESLRRHSGARRKAAQQRGSGSGLALRATRNDAEATRAVRRRAECRAWSTARKCPRSSGAGRSGRARGCIAAARPVTPGSSRCRRDTSPRR